MSTDPLRAEKAHAYANYSYNRMGVREAIDRAVEIGADAGAKELAKRMDEVKVCNTSLLIDQLRERIKVLEREASMRDDAIAADLKRDAEAGEPLYVMQLRARVAELEGERDELLAIAHSIEVFTCNGFVSWSLVTKEDLSEIWKKCAKYFRFNEDTSDPFGPTEEK